MADTSNEFEDAAASVMQSQVATVRNNVYNAVTQNPTQVAQHSRLANSLGVPIESVQSDPTLAKQQVAMQNFDAQKVVTQYPHLAQFLSNPTNAGKSHDDLQNLAATEQAVKELPQPAGNNAAPSWENSPSAPQPGLLADAVTGVKSTAYKVFGAWDKAAVELNDLIPDGIPGKMSAEERAMFLARGQSSQGTALANAPQRWSGQVASGLSYIPFMEAAPFVMGGSEGTAASQELRHQGVDANTATTAGVGKGLLLAATQMIPMGNLVFGQGANTLAKSVAGATLKAGSVGAGQSVIDDTATSQLLKAKGYGALADRFAPSIDKAWDSALFMAALHLGTQGVTKGVERFNDPKPFVRLPVPVDIVENTAKAAQASDGMQGIQALSQISQASELRKNDPQAFHDFVQQVTEDGNLPEVWVDGQHLVSVLHQSGISMDEFAAQMPDVANQINEAIETHSDVRIPTADYATHIAGSPIESAILEHLKTDPDGLTFKQGQEELAKISQEMTARAQQAVSQDSEADQRTTQLQAIREDVQRQLEETKRFTPDVARQYAALYSAFYDNMSERMGVSPAEMRERTPLSIEAEGLGGYSQGERGSFNPETKTIYLSKDADLSTFLHESGHFFLEAMHDMAWSKDVPAGIKSDFDTLLKSFKVEGGTPEDRLANWSMRDLEGKREGHEQFANSFEDYLMTGKAPVPELQSLFSRFRSWLMNVYQSLRGEVSPEVRGVMDRMFASQEAIAEAERVRGYAMPEIKERSELTEEYKALGKEATEQAISDMQARSMRDMKWLSNAKGRAMRELQRTARDERAKIRDEVTKEVMQTPIRQAETALKEAKPKTEMDRDLLAEQFGFSDGVHMQVAIEYAGPVKDQITGLTDQRMLERHGELTDPVSIERAAEAAIHNEARAKMMATGLKIFTKSPISVREINKATKAVADTTIAQKNVGDVRPVQYSAAEARANKELLKLAPKDPMGAATAQREALLNNRLFKSASEAIEDVRKGLVYLSRFNRDSIRSKVDVDIRDQIDDLLSRFDLRKNPTDAPTRAQQNLQQWVESQVASGMMPSVSPEMLMPEFRKPYREMTVEQFRGLIDTVKSMEHMGRERNAILVNGEKVELRSYIDGTLIPKLKEAGEKFSAEKRILSPQERELGAFGTGLDHLESFLRSSHAELKPQDFRANMLDRHEILGPVYSSLIEPVMDGSYAKVKMLKGLSEDFEAKARELGKDWQKSLNDFLPNDKLLDPQLTEANGLPVFMKISRGKMLLMALHSGNESNFDKLTKGYKWEPSDVWNFLSANMSAKDIAAVNHIWELNDRHWPEVEKLYHDMGQTVPPKIEARSTELPNGRLNGGYARINYDPKRSMRGAREEADQAKEIAAKGVSVGDYFKSTGTANGAMNARMEGYTDAINLDYHTIAQALRETIHDLSYRRALVDSNKIITDRAFKAEFQKAYGEAEWKAINTWLGRVANANNSDLNTTNLSKVLQYSRTGMVINGIGFNLATVIKHGGAAATKSLGYMAGGGEKFFGSRMASMFTDYTHQIESAKEKFSEIFARTQQMDRDFSVTAHNLFEPDSWHAKLDRAGHSMIANLDLFSAVPTAWAAYDRAVTVGIPESQGGTGKPMSEADAVRYANKMVREAHGSNVEAARSNFMNNPSDTVKMFGTLYGFMNNTYGQMANITSRLMTPDLSKSTTFAQAFSAILVPAIMAEAVSSHFHKGDEESWAEWMGKAIAGEVAGCVPFVRDAVSMMKGYKNAGQVPVESWLNTLVGAGRDVIKVAQGEGAKGKPVQDIANAIGETAHLPLSQFGKTLQYYLDRKNGKIDAPKDALHTVTDPLLGAPKK